MHLSEASAIHVRRYSDYIYICEHYVVNDPAYIKNTRSQLRMMQLVFDREFVLGQIRYGVSDVEVAGCFFDFWSEYMIIHKRIVEDSFIYKVLID